MGDAFTDNARQNKQAEEWQDAIDKFFRLLSKHLFQKKVTKSQVMDYFPTFDEKVNWRMVDRGRMSVKKRAREMAKRIASVKKDDYQAWAELLTIALMEASRNKFDWLRANSPFASRPVVIIIPSGRHSEPRTVGDFRAFHDRISKGEQPKAYIVMREERNVAGLNGDGKYTMRSNHDDMRFISF